MKPKHTRAVGKRGKPEWERIVLERGRENDQQPRINANEREFRI